MKTIIKETEMTTYAVTVIHPDGYKITCRYISKEVLLDGLVSFGGIKLFGGSRQPIVEWHTEKHTPTADEITCNGQFGCE